MSSNQVIGRLDDFSARAGFCITPIVVWEGGPVELSPDPNEVERVSHIPLAELNRSDVLEMIMELRTRPPVICPLLPTLGHRIYAPTLAILYQFREVALHTKPPAWGTASNLSRFGGDSRLKAHPPKKTKKQTQFFAERILIVFLCRTGEILIFMAGYSVFT